MVKSERVLKGGGTMPISKQDATALIVNGLAGGRNRDDLVQELCAKTGGTREQIQRFVQLLEAESVSWLI